MARLISFRSPALNARLASLPLLSPFYSLPGLGLGEPRGELTSAARRPGPRVLERWWKEDEDNDGVLEQRKKEDLDGDKIKTMPSVNASSVQNNFCSIGINGDEKALVDPELEEGIREVPLGQVHNEAEETRNANPKVSRKVIECLLRPQSWKLPPVTNEFILDSNEISWLCNKAEALFSKEENVLSLRAPVKVFGDIHGQFSDLLRFFQKFGTPSVSGDIRYSDYLFLGDYVDRGQHSLEVITLLLALKVEFPKKVHLIRGNHEVSRVNKIYGFQAECRRRLGEREGIWTWLRFNKVFNWLPLAAVVEKKIVCMHGGIGGSINFIQDIQLLKRPITNEGENNILWDLLWSDPTKDGVSGVKENVRGPRTVTFGPDRVLDFCTRNHVELIIRAHQCVMDGFERFAQGHLITVFSAPNYCGTKKNAGAILEIGRDLVIIPKIVHPEMEEEAGT